MAKLSPQTIAALRKAFAVWAPPRREAHSDWMEREYVVSSEESAEPGRYSFGKYAFLREIFNSFGDDTIEMIPVVKAAQIGWTAGFTGLLGCLVDNDPSRILVAMPTQDEGAIWSKDRFEPNIRATPALRAKVAVSKSRDGSNTILHKRFAGGTLKIVGANSSTGLSSWPAKYAFCDEVDRYPLSAGGEGDPIALVRKRLQTWLARGGKIGLGSTPKVEQTSIIWHYYLQGDQRQWQVKCRHCDEHHLVDWDHIKWEAGHPQGAVYRCPQCGVAWTDLDRLIAISKGEWVATAIPPDPKVRSYWIPGPLSPHVTAVELATKYEACETDDQKQAFMNLYVGKPWKVVGEAPDWQRLYDRREDWPHDRLPAGVLFLTVGVDVQKDRLEARAWGWGRGRQSWLIDRRIIMGDPSRDEVWEQLDKLIAETWTHESGAEIAITCTAVDSGYATADVYRWCKKHGSRRAIAVDGRSELRQTIGAPVLKEVVGRKKSRAGAKVWPVGVNHIKPMLYGGFRKDAPLDGASYPDGYVHLSKAVADDNEIRQLTAEELVTEKNKMGFSRQVWQLIAGRRNEALDCWVYAYAAAVHHNMERFGEAAWSNMEVALSNRVELGAPADSVIHASRAVDPAPQVTAAPPPPPPRQENIPPPPTRGSYFGRRR